MFEIVAIVASMGGPLAVRELIAKLPAEFPSAVVVIQHRTPRTDRLFVDLLAKRARLAVRMAEPGGRPQAGIVDVAPAHGELVLGSDGAYALNAQAGFFGCPADPLLRTVAETFGARAIGVVLSGTQDDGAIGMSLLKRHGGWTLAQDRSSARFFGMPSAAIATGCVDYVLPLHRIADALVALTMWPGASDLFKVPSPFWAEAAA